MINYKFQKKLKDPDLQNMQREIEDNFAVRGEVDDKQNIVKDVLKSEPRLLDMKDGELRYYDDGTNVYLYKRVGSRLIKFQGSEV